MQRKSMTWWYCVKRWLTSHGITKKLLVPPATWLGSPKSGWKKDPHLQMMWRLLMASSQSYSSTGDALKLDGRLLPMSGGANYFLHVIGFRHRAQFWDSVDSTRRDYIRDSLEEEKEKFLVHMDVVEAWVYHVKVRIEMSHVHLVSVARCMAGFLFIHSHTCSHTSANIHFIKMMTKSKLCLDEFVIMKLYCL